MFPGNLAGNSVRRQILGSLSIDTSDLRNAESRVQRAAANIEDSLRRAGNVADKEFRTRISGSVHNAAEGLRAASQAARDFADTDLGTIAKGLDTIAEKTRSISLAAGIGASFGVKEANNLFRQNKLLEALSKNQAQVVQRQKQFRDLADQTNQSYLTILESANILLPTIGKTNADLSQALTLVQRLALLDPAQGVKGAGIALREALGEDPRSLAFRFELPRAAVRRAINEAAGDPQKLIEALDKLVTRYGISQDKFLELMSSGINAFQRFRDTARNALGEAFMPLLTEFLIPGANILSNFLQNLIDNHKGLLSVVAGVTLLTATISPLAFITSKLITMWGILGSHIKAAAAAMVGFVKNTAFLKTATVGLGIGAGLAGATALANAGVSGGDLERIRSGESALDILVERVKQLIVVVIGVAEGLVNALLGVGDLILNSFGYIVSQILTAGAQFKEGFHSLIGSILQAALSIAESNPLFAGLAEQLRKNIEDHKAYGEVLASETRARESEVRARKDALTSRLEWFNTTGLGQAGGVTDAVFRALFPDQSSKEGSGPGEFRVSPLENLERFFYRNQQTILETWEKIKKIQDDFAEDFAKVTAERLLKDTRQQEDQNISDFRQTRDHIRKLNENYDDFLRNQAKNAKKTQEEIAKTQRNAEIERNDRRREFEIQERRQAQDHQRRLLEIQQNARVAMMEAASQLDAEGVFRAQENAKKQADEERAQYDLRRQRQAEDFKREQEIFERNLAARLENIQKEADERARLDYEEYLRRRNQQIAEFNQRRADEQEDRDLRRRRMEEDRQLEDELRRTQRDKAIEKLISEMSQEISLWQNIKSLVTDLASTAGEAMSTLFLDIVRGVQKAIGEVNRSFNQQSSGPIMGPVNGPKISPGQPPKINWNIPIFDTGTINAPRNRDILVGVRGPEILSLGVPGRITSPGDTARIMRNSGIGGGNISVGEVHVHVGDIGQYTPEEATAIVKMGLIGTLSEIVGNNPV